MRTLSAPRPRGATIVALLTVTIATVTGGAAHARQQAPRQQAPRRPSAAVGVTAIDRQVRAIDAGLARYTKVLRARPPAPGEPPDEFDDLIFGHYDRGQLVKVTRMRPQPEPENLREDWYFAGGRLVYYVHDYTEFYEGAPGIREHTVRRLYFRNGKVYHATQTSRVEKVQTAITLSSESRAFQTAEAKALAATQGVLGRLKSPHTDDEAMWALCRAVETKDVPLLLSLVPPAGIRFRDVTSPPHGWVMTRANVRADVTHSGPDSGSSYFFEPQREDEDPGIGNLYYNFRNAGFRPWAKRGTGAYAPPESDLTDSGVVKIQFRRGEDGRWLLAEIHTHVP